MNITPKAELSVLESPTTPSADYVVASPKPESGTLPTLARKWYALRWQLSRTVFSRPVPFVTEALEIKRGDLILTLPVSVIVIAINAYLASQHEVGGSGSLPSIVMAVVFALAVRNNFVLQIATGISFERAIFYHKFFAGVAWILSGLHGLAYLLENDSEAYDDSKIYSGAVAFFALTALVLLAFYKIRRLFFDLFLRFHWILFLVVVVAAVIHGAGIVLVGFVPFVLDLLFRFGYRTRNYNKPNGAIAARDVTVRMVSKDVVRVQFPRVRRNDGALQDPSTPSPSFQYEAGQYVFLCFPQVSSMEWHPFSIASAPHEPMVTIYIKVSGDWTKKLADKVASTEIYTNPSMLVDGPYGSVSIEMEHYSHFVFISGGIGATPMLSLANSLHYEEVAARSRQKTVEKAWFVWSVRDREIMTALMGSSSVSSSHYDPTTHSWLPHALVSPSNANSRDTDAFYAQIFLTKGEQDLSQPIDQQLSPCLAYGARPDYAKTLTEMGELAINRYQSTGTNPTRVGVLVCGPAAMVSDVLRQSLVVSKALKGAVVFDVHQETFNL